MMPFIANNGLEIQTRRILQSRCGRGARTVWWSWWCYCWLCCV